MTTDLDRIAEALRQADAAGDVEGARKLASYYRQAAQAAAAAAPAADQPGRLGSFASNVGRGALSVIPGTVGGVGYALGSDTLTGAADTIEGGINRMLPVNPEYQDELLMKGGQAVGQAIGMLGTGGAVGAAGKSLALSRGLAQGAAAAKGANLAKNVMLGTGIAQGTRGGGQAAEQYGMQGGAAYARALLGGAIEGATERYLFGMGTELAPVKKFLGEAAEKGVGGIIKSTGTEAGEEAVSQIGGNVATSVLAPYGVQTPGVLEGVGESALLGGIAGGTIGGINALMQPSPTIEGDALVPTEQAPPPVEEPEDDYGVAAFQQQMTEIAAQPDPIAPIQQTVTAAAENSVRVNANVLPATAAVIEAGGLAPAPTVEQPAPVVEQPRTREEEIAQMRARLRLNLSAEEREDMEQQLAQAQAEGAAADQTAEERRQAIQREDIIRRQQDREAELQRLAEERQRATAREQQRQQPPVVEETVAPIQPVPVVEETGAPQESAARKPRKFSVNPVSDFINEQRIEADLQQRQSDWREKQTERITSKDIITADWEKIRDDIQRGRRGLTVEKALAMVNDAFDKKVIPKQWHDILTARISSTQRPVEETGAPEITPEQVPNVENVIDEPGAAEVGLGMEKTQAREGSYTSEERDTFTETPIEKRRDRFVVSAITGTVFDRFFSMAVTPPAFKDQQAAADALNASEYNKTIPLPVSLGQKDGQSFFVSAYEGQPEVVIQPTSSPASAPAPTVQRDVTKPEQMTPEEYLTPKIAKLEKEIVELEANEPKVSSNAYLYWQPKLMEAKRNLKALKEDRDTPGTGKPWAPELQQRFIFESLEVGEPVSAAAVDAYKITLPEGYVRQGDLYVFQPSGTVEVVTEEKAPAKPKNMAGEVRPERAKPTPAPEFTTLHPKTQEKFNTAFEAKDAGAMNSLLDPTNKGSRAEFERRTGVKLPTTQKGTRDSVETWAATTPVADLTDTELDRDLLRLGEYSKKTYASDALKARALELAKEFQKRQDVAATDKAAGEASSRKKAIAKKALAATGGRGTVGNLAGDSLAQVRADLLSEITGTKVPKSKAGINALMKAFYQEFGIAADTEAGMQKKLAQTLQDAVTETAPQPKPAAEVETPVAGVPAEFSPDDKVLLRSPFMDADEEVSYRGPLDNDKSVVVSSKGIQSSVNTSWLRKKGTEFKPENTAPAVEAFTPAPTPTVEMPKTKEALAKALSGPEPQDYVLKKTWSSRVKNYLKNSKDQLAEMWVGRQESDAKAKQKAERWVKLAPQIQAIADEAGLSWRKTLSKLAADNGFSNWSAMTDNSKAEEVSRLAGWLAENPNSVVPTTAEFGSANTVVTKEAKDQAAKSLRESLGQTNVGLNPATLKYAITVGTYYLEGGVRSFADFSAKMVEEFGEGVRKYLQPAYEALRKRTDIDTAGMDAEEGVETAPVAEAPTAPAAAPAARVEAETPKAAPTQAAPTQAAPKPAAVAESDVVGIANARVKAQRERLNLEELNALVGEAYSFPQMWADSESALKVDPTRGSALVKELNEKPRSLKPLEVAILLREEVVRTNALNQAMEEFNAAPSGNNEVERQRMDEAVVALTEVDNAAKVSGTEQGRALNARKLLAKLDYTLPKMLTTLSAANNGSLKDGDLEMVTRLQKRLKDVQDQLAEVESGQADRIAEAEKIAFEAGRQEVLKDIEERAKNEAERVAEMQKRKAEYLAAKKEAAKTPSKWEEIRAAARARNAELRSNLYSDVVLVKAASMAVNDVIIGATYIAEGVTKFADWVSKMRSEDINLTDDEMQQLFKESKAFDAGEDLPASETPLKVKKEKAPAIDKVKAIAADEEALDSRTVYNLVVEKMKARVEANPALEKVEMSTDDLTSVISEVTADVQEFFPDITEREIRNLFSGYGIILKPSKDDLAKQIRQLSALGKLQSAIEDAEAKRAPLKSGPQRDKATQAIRLQQKKLARELRMMGRDYEAGEEQLRSPLDAIKARLNNQIDDLAMEINTRKKAPRRPSVDYDKDTQELADLRDELKRISDFINAPAGPTFTELVNEEMKKLDARIAELNRLLAEGNFVKKEDKLLHTEELDEKRAVRDKLNKALQKKRKEEADKLRTQEDIDKEAFEAVEEAIAELNRKIEAEDYALPQRRTPTQTAQYEARVNEKKRLQQKIREEREKLFGRKGMSDEQRIKQATAAIDKSVARMQKMLDSGNYDVPKRTSKTPETPALKAKRDARDKMRKRILELRKLKRDALIDPIAKQLKTDKKRIQTRMDKLKKRMETGDFSKPEKRKKATDDELLALQVEEENLKEAWAKMVFERQLASRGPGKRLLDAGQQTLNTARAVLTSFDVSAVLRQGGFIVLGNPLRGFRNLGPMFQAFGSDKFAKEEKFRLERRENFKNGAYQQSKLFLADVNKVDQMTQQEEAFMSRWIKKLPKGAKGLYIGSAIQGSQRAYTVFLNRLRMDTFDAMVANLKKGSEPTPQEMSAVANYINIATGRGDLGKFNQAGTMLNTVFFAPRLVASRFQILAGYPYFTASGRTKALVLREYGKFFAGATLVYVIGALAQGDDDEPIETDPRSSDFLKIRFGDTRVDPLSGLIQATVIVSRLVSGEKKQASGKIVPIRGEKVPYGADDSFDVMGNFVRTKFSPIVGSAVNVVTGKNVVGEPTDIGEETKRMLIPMSFTEMKETLEAQGVPEATALIMLQLFGMGVQTYTPGKK